MFPRIPTLADSRVSLIYNFTIFSLTYINTFYCNSDNWERLKINVITTVVRWSVTVGTRSRCTNEINTQVGQQKSAQPQRWFRPYPARHGPYLSVRPPDIDHPTYRIERVFPTNKQWYGLVSSTNFVPTSNSTIFSIKLHSSRRRPFSISITGTETYRLNLGYVFPSAHRQSQKRTRNLRVDQVRQNMRCVSHCNPAFLEPAKPKDFTVWISW